MGQRPHRCNDRVEDAVQALFERDFRNKFLPRARLAWKCFLSKPGEEPTDPYEFIVPGVPSKGERRDLSDVERQEGSHSMRDRR